jgi:hypothetical protein
VKGEEGTEDVWGKGTTSMERDEKNRDRTRVGKGSGCRYPVINCMNQGGRRDMDRFMGDAIHE